MKKNGMFFLFLQMTLAFCTEIDGLNGGFEKVVLREKIIMPAGWYRNNNVTKNAQIELCEEKSLVHGGKRSLYMESESNGRGYVFHSGIEYQAGKVWRVSAFIKGTGKVKLGMGIDGFKEDKNTRKFISSLSSKPFEASSKFRQVEWIFQYPPKTLDGVEYKNFILVPFIDVQGSAILFIDDFAIEELKKR